MDFTVHGILQARILEWLAVPFSRGSSQPRGRTQVSHIAGRFFTSWATREAQEYWSEQPVPSPGDLPDLEIEQGSPTLEADSLPGELLQFSSVAQLCLTPCNPMDCSIPGLPYSNSSPSSWWCHPTISSSVVPFSSHLQSFSASGSFQMSQLFASDGQSIGVSVSTSVLALNRWAPREALHSANQYNIVK